MYNSYPLFKKIIWKICGMWKWKDFFRKYYKVHLCKNKK